MTPLRIKLLRPGAQLPRYARPGDSGLDLAACLDAPVVVPAGGVMRIPTGLAFGIPEGHEGQVRPRSGLSARGIEAVLGTVDQSYRGEVAIILANRSGQPFLVEHGMRVAQLVIAPVARCEVVEVSELGETARGEQGFGSTGVAARGGPPPRYDEVFFEGTALLDAMARGEIEEPAHVCCENQAARGEGE